MLSFSLEAAQGELGLLIRRGKGVLLMPRNTVPQVEVVLRTEADWLREVYDTLTLVFHKNTQADTLLETGPRHPRGALCIEIGAHFEQRMTNRLSLLDKFLDRIDADFDQGPSALRFP